MKHLTAVFLLFLYFSVGTLAGDKPKPLELSYRSEIRDDAVDVYIQLMPEISRLKPREEADLGDRLAKAAGARKAIFVTVGDQTKIVFLNAKPTEVKVEAALAVLEKKFNWKFVVKAAEAGDQARGHPPRASFMGMAFK
jgi:hypothetical protein